MDSRIQNSRVNDLLIGQPTPTPVQAPKVGDGPDFASILQDRLKVSGHAQTRMQSRNIELGGALEAIWQEVELLRSLDPKAAAKSGVAAGQATRNSR